MYCSWNLPTKICERLYKQLVYYRPPQDVVTNTARTKFEETNRGLRVSRGTEVRLQCKRGTEASGYKLVLCFQLFKSAHEQNHKRYQVLGHLITQYVYELLERVCMLQKVCIVTDATEDELRSFFFMSKNALTSSSSLIVLLQDRGVFRAGQWGQRIIVSEGLRHGTQIPFIKMALQNHREVILLNPNDNLADLKTEKEERLKHFFTSTQKTSTQSLWWIPKRGSSSPEEHTMYVWDHLISKSAAKNVALIAHGCGGLVFVDLLVQRKQEVMNKVCSVAFIGSVHHIQHQSRRDPQIEEWIRKHCHEWVSNSKPLDKPLGSLIKVNCPVVSAGTNKYGLAPSCCLHAIFKYLKSELKAKTTTALRFTCGNQKQHK